MSWSELTIAPVEREREAEFRERMRRHHDLGAPCKIGESAYYAAVLEGRWVALSSFNAPVRKSRARDGWIGWCPEGRDVRRHLLLNQSRFLVLERIPNLASRALSLRARRVAEDRPGRYGHPPPCPNPRQPARISALSPSERPSAGKSPPLERKDTLESGWICAASACWHLPGPCFSKKICLGGIDEKSACHLKFNHNLQNTTFVVSWSPIWLVQLALSFAAFPNPLMST